MQNLNGGVGCIDALATRTAGVTNTDFNRLFIYQWNIEYDRGADMSNTTQTVSKNERDVIAAEISEILKDVPIVGYRDEKGVLVLPADDDEDY